MTSFASFIPALSALLVAVILIVVAIIAHWGKSFWGTWMMVLGSLGTLLGAIATVVAAVFLLQAIDAVSGTTTSSKIDKMTRYGLISGGASLVTFASMLAYLFGLLGLAVRYGAVNRRVTELESIANSLASNQNQSPR